jgi:hypothetical protein
VATRLRALPCVCNCKETLSRFQKKILSLLSAAHVAAAQQRRRRRRHPSVSTQTLGLLQAQPVNFCKALVAFLLMPS